MRAIRISRTGGPEVIEIADLETPAPRPGQILVRNQAIGVNFIDTYHRSGLYPVKLPSGLGTEGAGLVEKVGEGVVDFAPGDLVGYAGGALSAYAELNVVPAARAVKLPAGMSADLAAAALIKGLTAECLLRRVYPVRAGQVVLIQAGAGGVGSILVQWAKRLGATVIATVGSDDKAERVRGLGADHVILYRHEDVAAEVKRITAGAGVSVVYDGVGASTFDGSLGSLARRGMFVSYGNASGPAPAIEPLRLMTGGSLFFTRMTMFDYTATRAEFDQSVDGLFEMIRTGAVTVDIGQTFALEDAQRAHEALEARATIGSTLLKP
jgi:NADPH2:quinone reductase